MNGKTKAAPRRKYSKDLAILSEACRGTTRRSEGFVGQCILARRLTLAFGVGREVWVMAAQEVVELMAKHTYRIGPTSRIG